jgi:hypothetical protein
VNLWGDVPLVLTTDYKANNIMLRTATGQVYQQIISDLKDAESLMLDNYSYSANQRVRANKGVATALLARVYLFTGDWVNAEAESSVLISNTSQYSLEPNLLKVFSTISKEAIIQFWGQQFPNELNAFAIDPSYGIFGGVLNRQFVDGFEPGDQRAAVWIGSILFGGNTFYGPLKYQDYAIPPNDYSTVLRLAEQYLIRAEACANQNKLASAIADINEIRNRAGLPNTTASTQSDLLDAVLQERRAELFTEWGHRWLDLKRTGRANAVLGPLKPGWKQEDSLYPIPESQLISNPAIKQNPS